MIYLSIQQFNMILHLSLLLFIIGRMRNAASIPLSWQELLSHEYYGDNFKASSLKATLRPLSGTSTSFSTPEPTLSTVLGFNLDNSVSAVCMSPFRTVLNAERSVLARFTNVFYADKFDDTVCFLARQLNISQFQSQLQSVRVQNLGLSPYEAKIEPLLWELMYHKDVYLERMRRAYEHIYTDKPQEVPLSSIPIAIEIEFIGDSHVLSKESLSHAFKEILLIPLSRLYSSNPIEDSRWHCLVGGKASLFFDMVLFLSSFPFGIFRITDAHLLTALDRNCFTWIIIQLAVIPVVSRVQIIPPIVNMNYAAKQVIMGCSVNEGKEKLDGITSAGKSFDGLGQIVGVADSGVNDQSCFFLDPSNTSTSRDGRIEAWRRKVIQYTPYADGRDELAGHGTHVVGSIIGNCPRLSIESGVAPAAKVAFFDIGITGSSYLKLPPMSLLLETLYEAGARVDSFSWGSINVLYGSMSLAFDRFLYEHDDLIVVFAAGNNGYFGPRTIATPANAKNVLSVGSVHIRDIFNDTLLHRNDYFVSPFSSMGPTYDRRIKPDIVAPGDYVVSALAEDPSKIDGCGLQSLSGTSMAAPLTAGSALLLRQWLTHQSDSLRLSSSGFLLKALFLHTAKMVEHYSSLTYREILKYYRHAIHLTKCPNNIEGYGMINLKYILSGLNDRVEIIDGSLIERVDERNTTTIFNDNSDEAIVSKMVMLDRLSLASYETLELNVSMTVRGYVYYHNVSIYDRSHEDNQKQHGEVWRLVPFVVHNSSVRQETTNGSKDDANRNNNKSFRDNGQQVVKVTLAWYDPPHSVGYLDKLLLHDLDLILMLPEYYISQCDRINNITLDGGKISTVGRKSGIIVGNSIVCDEYNQDKNDSEVGFDSDDSPNAASSPGSSESLSEIMDTLDDRNNNEQILWLTPRCPLPQSLIESSIGDPVESKAVFTVSCQFTVQVRSYSLPVNKSQQFALIIEAPSFSSVDTKLLVQIESHNRSREEDMRFFALTGSSSANSAGTESNRSFSNLSVEDRKAYLSSSHLTDRDFSMDLNDTIVYEESVDKTADLFMVSIPFVNITLASYYDRKDGALKQDRTLLGRFNPFLMIPNSSPLFNGTAILWLKSVSLTLPHHNNPGGSHQLSGLDATLLTILVHDPLSRVVQIGGYQWFAVESSKIFYSKRWPDIWPHCNKPLDIPHSPMMDSWYAVRDVSTAGLCSERCLESEHAEWLVEAALGYGRGIRPAVAFSGSITLYFTANPQLPCISNACASSEIFNGLITGASIVEGSDMSTIPTKEPTVKGESILPIVPSKTISDMEEQQEDRHWILTLMVCAFLFTGLIALLRNGCCCANRILSLRRDSSSNDIPIAGTAFNEAGKDCAGTLDHRSCGFNRGGYHRLPKYFHDDTHDDCGTESTTDVAVGSAHSNHSPIPQILCSSNTLCTASAIGSLSTSLVIDSTCTTPVVHPVQSHIHGNISNNNTSISSYPYHPYRIIKAQPAIHSSSWTYNEYGSMG